MAFRSGFKTPSKAQWLRCKPPINAHPPQADCAFSSGLTLDASINLFKIDM
jgi:hypothetical protein